MNKFSAVIIDDEASAVEALVLLLEKYCPEIVLLGSANDVPSGIHLIKNKQPEVVFLDIEMPGKNGFELLKAFDSPSFDVVFSTAHLHYAVQAIRLAAMDFLLKPVDPVELMQLVQRKLAHRTPVSVEQLAVARPAFTGEQPEIIALPTQTGFLFRSIEEIVRLEADNNYTRLFFRSEPAILVSKTLKNFEEILPSQFFLRIHRSHLIRVSEVREFLRTKSPSVILSDGLELPVASEKREALFNHLLSLS